MLQHTITGITYIENFLASPEELFTLLATTVQWEESMTARKTGSFGKAYDYSQMTYPFREFLPEIEVINTKLEPVIGFKPNNCLINYYPDGASKMGYHSDQTDILEANTGIAIISVGEMRTLVFRNKNNPLDRMMYELPAGSLIYMTHEIQEHWLHAIPASKTEHARISLTFRKIM
jgi:alkylated DNA repair dioxygenase AlkB